MRCQRKSSSLTLSLCLSLLSLSLHTSSVVRGGNIDQKQETRETELNSLSTLHASPYLLMKTQRLNSIKIRAK